jgi:hypothetical protein
MRKDTDTQDRLKYLPVLRTLLPEVIVRVFFVSKANTKARNKQFPPACKTHQKFSLRSIKFSEKFEALKMFTYVGMHTPVFWTK